MTIDSLINAYLADKITADDVIAAGYDNLLPAIEQRLSNAKARQQWRLLLLLDRTGDPQALPLILPFLNHSVKALRSLSAEVMGKLGNPHAVEPLMACLQDQESTLYIPVIRSLGQLGAKQAIPRIRDLLKATDSEVIIYTALDSLANLGDASLLPDIAPFLEHSSHHVRSHAKQAVQMLQAQTS